MSSNALADKADATRGWTPAHLLYAPWAYGVWVPFLAVSTAFLGTVALIVSRFSQRAAFHCGTAWAWMLCALNWTRVRVRGRENMEPGRAYVIMSNHLSHFDVLAMYGHWYRQFRWVMKAELRKVPFLGPATAAFGNVFVDRSNHEKAMESLRSARSLFDQGISVIIFPEGTRSRDGKLGPFKKGGFILAIENQAPILPVTISGTRSILPGRSLRLLPGRVTITIHEPIPTKGMTGEDLDTLVERVRTAIAGEREPSSS